MDNLWILPAKLLIFPSTVPHFSTVPPQFHRGFPVFHNPLLVEKPVYPLFSSTSRRYRFPQSPPIFASGKGCGKPQILYNSRDFAKFAAVRGNDRQCAVDKQAKLPGLQPFFPSEPPSVKRLFRQIFVSYPFLFYPFCTVYRGVSTAINVQYRNDSHFSTVSPPLLRLRLRTYLISLYIRRITAARFRFQTETAVSAECEEKRLRRANRRAGRVAAFPEMQES